MTCATQVAGLRISPQVEVPHTTGRPAYDEALLKNLERVEQDLVRMFRFECAASPECSWRGARQGQVGHQKTRRVVGVDVVYTHPDDGHYQRTRQDMDRKIRKRVVELFDQAERDAMDAYRESRRRSR